MKELNLIQILFGVLFIGLKLGEVITWSWWLVLLPFYGSCSVISLLIISWYIYALLSEGDTKGSK